MIFQQWGISEATSDTSMTDAVDAVDAEISDIVMEFCDVSCCNYFHPVVEETNVPSSNHNIHQTGHIIDVTFMS